MAGCKVIGLYGGAGSGKSEAARYLKEKYGAYIIKADELGHRLYSKNQPGYNAIVRICGKGVLDADRQINYPKLADTLFKEPSLLHQVNKAIHPMVYAKTRELISAYKTRKKRGMIFFEAALLPDRDLDFIDENWYIHSDISDRSERMIKTRDYSESKISSVISNQPAEERYRAFCDYVVENNQTIKELEENIDEAVKHCQRK